MCSRQRPALLEFIASLEKSGGVCHLLGLLSPGGVHAHTRHILGLARIVAARGIKVCLHGFLDGRDVPPRSAADHLSEIAATIESEPGIEIASLSGRYWAMDRDHRWDRVAIAYATLVEGAGGHHEDPVTAILDSYANDIGDEFLRPVAIATEAGMADGDGLLMANFRADRTRQLLSALLDPGFDGFKRGKLVNFAASAGMVSYSEFLDGFLPALFAPVCLKGTLPELVSRAGMTQLRIAETEKYAHVTFFLNGGSERVFEGEERILIPSPKVATYDLAPEMSALELTRRLVLETTAGRFDLIVVNYANPDMVGHTGKMAACVQAIETIDRCLAKLEAAVRASGGHLLITADHGNAEMMSEPGTGASHTAHTTNPVPLLLVNAAAGATLRNGRLADVAPTVLEFLRLAQPPEMTGVSLLTCGRAAAKQAASMKDGEPRVSA